MLQAWRERFQTVVRYRLIALVLLPLLLAMILSMGYALYWLNSFTYDTLVSTARSDLALARRALIEWQEGHQITLQQLGESVEFRRALAGPDPAAMQSLLARIREEKGFLFLHVTGVAGDWLFEPRADGMRSSKPSPLTDRAARGLPGTAFEVFGRDDLVRESSRVVQSVGSDGKSPGSDARALVLRVAQPVTDARGRTTMVLDGAVLLNRNAGMLEFLRDRLTGGSAQLGYGTTMVTLLLADTRISTSGDESEVLLGTRVGAAVQGGFKPGQDAWVGRERLGRTEFVSAYGPLFNVHGQPVGYLNVGLRESSLRAVQYRAAGLLLLLFAVATILAGWIGVRGMRSVFRPIERMTAVVRATQAGENQRIGALGSADELGELGRQFDELLDQLQERNRELHSAAHVLEDKVNERTRELAEKNLQLEKTIALLQETREQLVLAEKLSALGQMAAGIAHEINNPAAVILGNLEVLAAELGAGARPVTREIELIEQQVERIRHITTGLLQFARSEPAAGPVEEVDSNWLVGEVLPLVGHGLKPRGIDLMTRLEATRPVWINVFDLEQVLVNLIFNAANAVTDGGRVVITTRDAEPGGVVLAVEDNGRGIPEEQLKNIFDPFFTGDALRGTGLGLSVSYGLVRRYDGNISVTSVIGKGSRFEVWLPQRSAARSSDRDGSPEATQEESRDHHYA